MGGLLDDGLYNGSRSDTPPCAADDGRGMAPIGYSRGKEAPIYRGNWCPTASSVSRDGLSPVTDRTGQSW